MTHSDKNIFDLSAFVKESNRIENIIRAPTPVELKAHGDFLNLRRITVDDLITFVGLCEPEARIRDKEGLNVRIGNHFPIPGSHIVVEQLEEILRQQEFMTPYQTHVLYETLHPFTDCNGRSGRALWAWQMRKAQYGMRLGFLHTFYYQSLEQSRRRI